MMPHFIERPIVNGYRIYAVWNETTIGENFADRWNSEPNRVKAFNQWHEKALSDFEELRDAVGIDKITFGLKKSLGDNVVTRVMGRRVENISRARESSSLFIAPAIGLTTKSVAASTPVPKNDFFGD